MENFMTALQCPMPCTAYRSGVLRLLCAAAGGFSLLSGVVLLLGAAPALAAPAWMILRVGWSAGAFGGIREFPSMAACEAAAEHISKVRTPGDATTAGVPGAWKFSFSRSGSERQEPLASMLCVPDASEIPAVQQQLEQKGWYKGL